MRRAAIVLGALAVVALTVWRMGATQFALRFAWQMGREALRGETGVMMEGGTLHGNVLGRIIVDSVDFGHVAHIDRIIADYNPLDFLFGAKVLRRIRIEGLALAFQNLGEIKPPPKPPGARTSVRLVIRHFELRRGRGQQWASLPELDVEQLVVAGSMQPETVYIDTLDLRTRGSRLSLRGWLGMKAPGALHARLAVVGRLDDFARPGDHPAGTLALAGVLDGSLAAPGFSGTLDVGRVRWQGWSIDTVHARLQATPTHIALADLRVALPGGDFAGAVDVQPRAGRWDSSRVRVALDGLWQDRPARLHLSLDRGRFALATQAYDATLDAEGSARGAFADPDVRAALRAAHQVEPLRVAADIRYARAVLAVDRLQATGARSRLALHGQVRFAPDLPFDGMLDIASLDIAEWQPVLPWLLPVRGRVAGHAELAGRGGRFQGSANLTGRDIVGYEEHLDHAQLELAIQGTEVGVRRFTAETRGGSLNIVGSLDFARRAMRFAARGNGLGFPVNGRVAGQAVPVGGQVGFELDGEGSLESPRARGRITVSKLLAAGINWGDIEIGVKLAHPDADVELSAGGGALHCTGRIALAGAFPFEGRFTARGYPIERAAGAVIVNYPLAGHVSFEARGRGTVTGWRRIEGALVLADLLLRSDSNQVAIARPCTLEMGERRVSASPLVLAVAPEGTLTLDGSIDLVPARPQLAATAHLDRVDLTAVNRGVKGLPALAGHVWVQARASGPLDDPELEGNLTTDDAGLRFPGVGVALDSVRASMLFSGRRIVVEKFTGHLGAGTVKLVGSLNLRNLKPAAYALRVAVSQGELARAREWDVRFNANLKVAGTPDSASVAGRVDVIQGEYRAPFEPMALVAALGRVNRPAARVPFLARSRLDVGVSAPGGFFVRNNVAQVEAEADLEARGPFDKPSLSGRITARPGGTIRYLDRTFEIEEATCDFTDPYQINPELLVQAQTEIVAEDTFLVRMDFSGTPQDWRLALSSEPPLAEPDIASLLLLGRTRGWSGLLSGTALRDQAANAALSAIEGTMEQKLAGFLGV